MLVPFLLLISQVSHCQTKPSGLTCLRYRNMAVKKRACVLLDTESINHSCWPHPAIAQLIISYQIAYSPLFFPRQIFWLYSSNSLYYCRPALMIPVLKTIAFCNHVSLKILHHFLQQVFAGL